MTYLVPRGSNASSVSSLNALAARSTLILSMLALLGATLTVAPSVRADELPYDPDCVMIDPLTGLPDGAPLPPVDEMYGEGDVDSDGPADPDDDPLCDPPLGADPATGPGTPPVVEGEVCDSTLNRRSGVPNDSTPTASGEVRCVAGKGAKTRSRIYAN